MIVNYDTWLPSSDLRDSILVANGIRVLVVHEHTEVLNVPHAGS